MFKPTGPGVAVGRNGVQQRLTHCAAQRAGYAERPPAGRSGRRGLGDEGAEDGKDGLAELLGVGGP